MLPLASFFAPCAVIVVEVCACSWQPAQTGGSAASAGSAIQAAASTSARTGSRNRLRIVVLLLARHLLDVWPIAVRAGVPLRADASRGSEWPLLTSRCVASFNSAMRDRAQQNLGRDDSSVADRPRSTV